jgi:DNA mismatch repair ATPase MutL
MPKINVSAKVISDLSSGIYRSPANALKELISNAFDADADNVVIRTNRPFYKTITYYDDGNGMSQEDFKWTMSHIGGSRKREGGEILFTKKGRPDLPLFFRTLN